MARTILEIKKTITTRFLSNQNLVDLYGLDQNKNFEDQFSLTAFETVFIDVFAFILYTFELIFDNHKKEVNTALVELKPHSPRWYRNKALAFQYGFDLVEDNDYYDNTGISPDEISASKIITYCAVTESTSDSRLIVKIATENSGQLTPISQPQKEAFTYYVSEYKDAGVRVTIINYLFDRLNLNLRIYRDPLVIDANGYSIRTGKKPVEDAISQYLQNLPFNGELVLAHLVDYLQNVDGVKIPHIIEASSTWIDPSVNDYGLFQPIDVRTIPVSGYFRLENFEQISYVV